jgi:hypothetical protein
MLRYTIRDNRNDGTRRHPRHERLRGLAYNLRDALEAVIRLNEREADKERFEMEAVEAVDILEGGRTVEIPTAWSLLMR